MLVLVEVALDAKEANNTAKVTMIMSHTVRADLKVAISTTEVMAVVVKAVEMVVVAKGGVVAAVTVALRLPYLDHSLQSSVVIVVSSKCSMVEIVAFMVWAAVASGAPTLHAVGSQLPRICHDSWWEGSQAIFPMKFAWCEIIISCISSMQRWLWTCSFLMWLSLTLVMLIFKIFWIDLCWKAEIILQVELVSAQYSQPNRMVLVGMARKTYRLPWKSALECQ